MTDIETIAIYGPGNLKPEDLVAGFVAREKTLEYFLNELRHQTTPGASPRHHLIIGQRGMGKTTLLLRIAVAIGEQQELADYFVPLTFREEQYNVINLHVFWRNCIESLLDWLEQQGRNDEAKDLEQQLNEVENAYEQDRKAEAGGNAAGRVFRQACQRLQRRPVLFLDNLDLIIDALKKHDWGLRDSLQQSDGPLVIGAAPAYPKSLSDRKAAFFDFFRITTLERLEIAEVRACLQRLAHRRGAAGTKVAAVLRRDPGRIDALTEMTGGNPRTLAVLYLLLESQAGEDAFADLEKLLDRMTPLYKARTEEAAPQARAVLDAVALNWDPITAKQVARDSGLDVTTVNAQLARLENDGYVEKVEVSGSGRSGYQIVERFFNIWYLMRHGNRRLRDRVRLLTILLSGIFSTNDREAMARDVLLSGKHKGRGDFMLALSESVDDPIYRKALSYIAVQDLVQQCDIRERIARLVDFRNIVPEHVDMLELEEQALAVKREWPEGVDAHKFWELLGGSLEISGAEKRKIIEQLPSMRLDELKDLTETLCKEIDELCESLNITEAELEAYRAAIRDGCIRHRYDLVGASAAALYENNTNIAAVGCLLALYGVGDLNEVNDTRHRFREQSGSLWVRIDVCESLKQSEILEGSNLMITFRGLGLLMQGQFQECEETWKKLVNTDIPQESCAVDWLNLGRLYHYFLKNYDKAEQAYRTAISLNLSGNEVWYQLAELLNNHLKKYNESELAYRKCIEIGSNILVSNNDQDSTLKNNQPIILDTKYGSVEITTIHNIDNSYPWDGLGSLLIDSLNRNEEAEAAFRKALELNPQYGSAWTNLGRVLHHRLNRYAEAEVSYQKALELDPKDSITWDNLGDLLRDYLSRYDEAESAYRKAIEFEPDDSYGWNGLGDLLQDYLGRYDEAELAYFKVIELEKDSNFAHANLAYLYWFHLNRPQEAQRHAEIAKPGLAECGQRLLDVMQALASDDLGSAWTAFDSALATDDKEIWVDYIDDLQRVLRYAVSRGYGLKFKEWMEAAGYPDRYAPLYWAFLALLEGEAILLNVNPEVRRTAERIYRGLTIGQKPEPVQPKRTRRQATK